MRIVTGHSRTDGTRGESKIRPEIQALRALAVALVVVFHLWPSALPGGFVGVDVFFAISGFLITGSRMRADASTYLINRVTRVFPASCSPSSSSPSSWLRQRM